MSDNAPPSGALSFIWVIFPVSFDMYPSNTARLLISSRARAFGWHVAASCVIAVLTLLLVFLVWYPVPLHDAVGVTTIFLLILLVDVSLGPAVTLMICKTGRRVPVIDIVLIVGLQLSALGYGLWAVAEGRPVWLVFNADRFDLVRANEVDVRKLDEARPEYRSAPWLGPKWVAAKRPVDAEARNAILFEALLAGVDLAQHPEHFVGLAEVTEEVLSRSRPLDELYGYNERKEVAEVLQQWPQADAWLPLKSGARSMTVLLDSSSAGVVSVVDLRPWEE